MSRVIKFRAWDNQAKIMRIDGSMSITDLLETQNIINQQHFNWLQYTGLTDKNGVEIYEGDIVNFMNTYDRSDIKEYWRGVVKFGAYNLTQSPNDMEGHCENAYGFYVEHKLSEQEIKDDESGQETPAEYHEVIGNIYETPELLI